MKKSKPAAKVPSKRKVYENDDKDLIKLGERIKQLRMERGYGSYEMFAFEHGINRSQFGRYERGEDLRYSSLLKVCEALGVSIKEFFSKGFE